LKTVLIVDDDKQFTEGLARGLGSRGMNVRTAASLSAARSALARDIPQFLLLDLMLPDGSGLELLQEFKEDRPEAITLITGHYAVKSFVRDMAGPSISYLTKPVGLKQVLRVFDELDDVGERKRRQHFGLLIGESDAMKAVYQQIRQVAPTDSIVLIQGESGTGKELVAEAIHRESGKEGRFVPVNCGALPKDIVTSELFGHEKGSFTGAGRQHTGYFERAGQGTLFLDEITETPAEIQVQLLRVLETGRFTRVGGEAEITHDARLVSATNQDPAEAVTNGHLREDLYFRLCVFPIRVPALRERMEDLEPLARYFLMELNQHYGTKKRLTDQVISQLQTHHWPGNIRELRHTINRAFIMAEGDTAELQAPKLFDDPLSNSNKLVVGQSIEEVEKQLILSTLEHYDGDKKAAAATLGVSLKTLYNRLKNYEKHG